MNFNTRSLLLTVSFFALTLFPLAGQVRAQLDPTFGTGGTATVDTASDDHPLANFVLPDGKTLLINRTADRRHYFVRFNSDGTFDETYGTNGFLQVNLPLINPNTGAALGAARQPDGKIILVGQELYGTTAFIARYNEDGSIDQSFAGSGVHRPNFGGGDKLLNLPIIQPDGKILVAGALNNDLALVRYNPDGTLDTTFDEDGMIYYVWSNSQGGVDFLGVQTTGKIIVGDTSEDITGGSGGTVRRFNADGSLDESFPTLRFPLFRDLNAVALQPDDKIVVGRKVRVNDALEREQDDCVVSRYTADGEIDTSFGTGGETRFDLAGHQYDKLIGLEVTPDGQILATGISLIGWNRTALFGPYLFLTKLSSDGMLNGRFLVKNIGTSLIFKSYISVLPDGKILSVVEDRSSEDADILLFKAVGVPLETHILHGVPFSFDGSGLTTPSLFRPDNQTWYIFPSPSHTFGLSDDILVPSDYLGSFNTELAVFRPSNGTWYIARNRFASPAGNFIAVKWGLEGDIPAPADYDGDGKSDVAVFRPSNGVWYIRNSSDNTATIVKWGLAGDKPVPGDYDGDGLYDIAVWRPSDGNWYIYRSSDEQVTIVHWGLDGDIPVQEDYDGDGRFDLAVYRPSTGVWYRLDLDDLSYRATTWGLAGDIPVPGDYDGDRKTNIAVWRPSNGYWYILNPGETTMFYRIWGTSVDIPLPGVYGRQ